MQRQFQLGPIDYLLIEFKEEREGLDPALARAIANSVDTGAIRVLDLVIISKSMTGDIDVIEFEELDQPELTSVAGTLAEILAYADIANLAMAIKPGTRAAAIVWEHTAVAPIVAATRDIGEQIIAEGRIPPQAVIATLREDQPEAD